MSASRMADPVEAFRAAAIARLKQASNSALEMSNDRKLRASERAAHAHAYWAFVSATVMVEALPSDAALQSEASA